MVDRRQVLGGLGAVSAAGLVPGRAWAVPPMPKSPVTITVVDVAGNLALTQKAIESYRKAKPNAVARFVFTKAPAPELPAKIKAQQDAEPHGHRPRADGARCLVGRARPGHLARPQALSPPTCPTCPTSTCPRP